MVITQLTGGLGNQLFEYALGRHLAELNNDELLLDTTGFETYKLHSYGLGPFNIRQTFATPTQVRSFRKYRRKPSRAWFLYNRLIADPNRYVEERRFNFDTEILTRKSPIYLEGFWQTEKYFVGIEDIIRQEVTVATPLPSRDKKVANQIAAVNAVSLHVRRTDYATDQKTLEYHGLCSIEYYRQAAGLIGAKHPSPHFFVFSDDHQWTKGNLKLPYPVTHVDHNGPDKNYEDLRLMSLCRHHIIANSSFSWWGAWLNPRKDKTVIAPARWFNNVKANVDTRDVVPDSWIRLAA